MENIILLIQVLLCVAIIAGCWKMFAKAGKPGWASLIPIYNTVVALQISGRPIWWIILLFIPIVNLVIGIMIAIDIARKFGKGSGYAVGMIFLPFIFVPMLGFGDAQYNAQA